MNPDTCPRCSRPIRSTWLCRNCVETAANALASIGGHYRDLENVKCRLTRYSVGGDRPSSAPRDRSLVVDLRFVDNSTGQSVEKAARRFLARWVHEAMTALPAPAGPACLPGACQHPSCRLRALRAAPQDTIQSVCRYLQALMPQVARFPWAVELMDDALRVEARLARLVDRPADRWYAGQCGYLTDDGYCERDLWADPADTWIRCRDCGAMWDVSERRLWLLGEAEDRTATAAEIARFVVTAGDADLSTDRLVKRISEWASRDRLTAQGTALVGGRERPVYRVGDVLRLLAEAQHRNTTTA